MRETGQMEMALDAEIYRDILQMIHEFGVNLERLPSLYAGRGEEDLRDLLIMHLSPHFPSVTGETFNHVGKTDILIRHEKENLFVAECKFWAGLKAFHQTIDQALSYLTWRDSKAAVICFIRTKQLEPVLEQIQHQTAEHAYHVKTGAVAKRGWYAFEFHLPEDDTRRVDLAVLCFHLPK